MKNFLFIPSTFWRLGFFNILMVARHRIFIKLPISRWFFRHQKNINLGTLFPLVQNNSEIIQQKEGKFDSTQCHSLLYYGYNKQKIDSPPNWFLNPFTGITYKNQHLHWTAISDFDPVYGDIKHIWELSRFNWLLQFANESVQTKDPVYLDKVNFWVNDWCVKNPINTGPNWKCGQETSLRAINVLLAWKILGSEAVSPGLVKFLCFHSKRIKSTIYYAKAQDNNHGISEAVALYTSSYFLWKQTGKHSFLRTHKKGQTLLIDRVLKLIMVDGSFSQHSVYYHRMILDLLSVVELFRRDWSIERFPEAFYHHIKLAIHWLTEMVDDISGKAPNLGANDGTILFNINGYEYSDFRPSLTLAASIFNVDLPKKLISKHTLLEIFKVTPVETDGKLIGPIIFNDGGYAKLHRLGGSAIMRLPVFKFRPSHCDALHVDVWQDGTNWIRDAGTYSYALPMDEMNYFQGTYGHSTIQFDDRNQMPRLSRFLFSNWLKPLMVSLDKVNGVVHSGYQDYANARHLRKLYKISTGWVVEDEISGVFKKAIQRWILKPGDWNLNDHSIKSGNMELIVFSDTIKRFELRIGSESRFYMQKSPAPILEVEFTEPCKITTEIRFNS